MASEVILPRVDMDMATGRISKWLAEPGARVAKGQPLFEIETDKAAMEIEAPADGTLRTLVAASGDDIPVGSTVAWIYGEGEEVQPAPAAPSDGAPAAAAPGVAPAPARVEPEDRPPGGASPSSRADERPRATPLARRLAREQGLDVGALTGSGPRGRIQAADVERAGTADAGRPAAAASAAPGPTPPVLPSSRPSMEHREPVPAAARPAGPKPASGRLALVQLRAGSGPPMLLVHGWGSDANGWRPFLAGQRPNRPVLALDLPGHGASPLGRSAAFTDLVDAVEATLQDAALGPAQVVAHSLGAAIMTAVAARHTLDLRSLLLLAPAGLGPAINGSFLEGFLSATSEASLTPWMHELVADPAVLTPAFVRATLKAREGTDIVAAQRRIAAAVFPDATQAFSIRPDLAKLAIPTRIVLGGADRVVPSSQAAGLPGLVATHHFPHLGHMPHLEAREAVSIIAEQMSGDSERTTR